MYVNKLLFPLTRLPENALHHFLRVSDLPQLIGISLLSKKCKKLVESLNLKLTTMRIWLTNVVVISLENELNRLKLTFYSENLEREEENGRYQGPLYKPPSIRLSQPQEIGNQEDFKWDNMTFEMRDWMKHLQFIFHRLKFQFIAIRSGGFELESALEHFKGFKKLRLFAPPDPIIQNQDIVRNVHKSQQLEIQARQFPNNKIPTSIFIQNFDHLCIRGPSSLELNDLLKYGSKNLDFVGLTTTGKEFNRFIKLWIKGSNPRMESLMSNFSLLDAVNVTDVILKDLDVQKMHPYERRLFKAASDDRYINVEDGWDIFRQDGTKATIMLSDSHIHFLIRMYVWHPECVVDNSVS